MFNKKIATGDYVDHGTPKEKFPKGTKFSRDNRLWKVSESFSDNAAEWRRCVADDGTDELVTLPTLHKDLESGTIKIIIE